MSGMMNALQGVDALMSGLQAGYANAFRDSPLPTAQRYGVDVRDYNNLVKAYNLLQSESNSNSRKLIEAFRVEKARATRLAAELAALKAEAG